MPAPSLPLLSFLSRSLSRYSSISIPRPRSQISHTIPFRPALFSTCSPLQATLNQVKRGCRVPQRARRKTSPQMRDHPQMKAVCLKVGVTKPKKPNSGERKIARAKLSNGVSITAYIPGEGHNVQQHSVILVRGGRSQDCPGVRYHVVRGACDVSGVANKLNSRSKYGTKKPKTK